MTSFVIDASVAFKWFHTADEKHVDEARAVLDAFVKREHDLFAPPIFLLEIINTPARKWNYDESALLELLDGLEALGIEVVAPDIRQVTRWTALGLSAYDACYTALAEAIGSKVITDDNRMQRLGGDFAFALSDFVTADE